jgi:site-specific recombinase XerD
VFTTRTGGPLRQRKVRRDFQTVLARAGLPRIRVRDLRHSTATLLLVQGVSPKVVADTLGYSDVRLTMNTYQHLVPVLPREVADKMQALLVPAE